MVFEDEKEVHFDMYQNISDKTDIEKIISSDVNDNLKGEKVLHLGMDKEDMLHEYTFDQLDELATYKEIKNIMSNHEVGKALISGKLPSSVVMKIIKEANKHRIPFAVLTNPKFKGEVALGFVRKKQ